MKEKSEKKILHHHPIEVIQTKIPETKIPETKISGTKISGTKKEKMAKIVEIIKNDELTTEALALVTLIPLPTMYKYIRELKQDRIIYEEDKKLYVLEKEKEDFNDDRFLEFILPEILYTVKIKRLLTLPLKDEPEESLNDDRENLKKRSIKTIIIEFTQRGYEQQIAELLYDKFVSEIALITVGIGGLIIYMSKNNKKSKVLSYLSDHMKDEK